MSFLMCASENFRDITVKQSQKNNLPGFSTIQILNDLKAEKGWDPIDPVSLLPPCDQNGAAQTLHCRSADVCRAGPNLQS